MAGPGRIAGIASFYIEGVPWTVKGSLQYQPTATKRTPIVALDGTLAGYSEEGEPPYMSVTMLSTGTFRVADLFNATNVQLVAVCGNGLIVTGHSMTLMDALEVKNEDATFDTKWIGVTVTEAPGV